jgi:RHS repeat-associated protein
VQTRQHNAQNELIQLNGTSLTYSANGNLTTDQEGRTLIYDAWNRLISVKNSGGTALAVYGYDGLNRRITEQVATATIPDATMAAVRDLFYSADWQVLEERVRVGGAIPAAADTRYVWSPVYVDAMVLRDRGSERVYALQDGNWNTTALIAASGVPGNATGDLIQRMVYNPYGEVFLLNPDWTEQLGTPLVPWQHLFQGLKFTESTGLGYVRNRDYSPSLGRFIELDPIGFSAGDNNWYRFVGNGPIGGVDPMGLAWTMEGVKALFCGTNYSWVICACLTKKSVYSADNLRAEQGDKTHPLNGVNQGDKGISVNSDRSDAEAASTLMHECLHDRTQGEGETPSDKYIDEEAKVRVVEEQWRIKMRLPMKNPRTADGKNGDFNKIKEKIKDSYKELAQGFEVKWDKREEIKFTCCD